MRNKWRVLAIGGGIAALFVVVGVEAATPSPSASPSANPAQVFVDKLASILHLSSSQTAADLKQAELATIDQMVKDGKITQAQGDALKQKIQNGTAPAFGLPGFGRMHGPGPNMQLMQSLRTAELNAAAKALKTDVSTLQSDLRSGKTPAQLEQAAGISDTALRDALKSAAKGVLDPAVKAGTITQAQEDALLNRISSGRLPLGGFGGPRGGGHGWFGPHPGGPGGGPGAPAPGTPQGYTE